MIREVSHVCRGMVKEFMLETFLHTEYDSSWPHCFRNEDFLRFFSYIALYKQITPWGVASLDPRGLTGKVYVGE